MNQPNRKKSAADQMADDDDRPITAGEVEEFNRNLPRTMNDPSIPEEDRDYRCPPGICPTCSEKEQREVPMQVGSTKGKWQYIVCRVCGRSVPVLRNFTAKMRQPRQQSVAARPDMDAK